MIETRTIIAKSFDMKQFLLVVLFSICSMGAAIAQSNVLESRFMQVALSGGKSVNVHAVESGLQSFSEIKDNR